MLEKVKAQCIEKLADSWRAYPWGDKDHYAAFLAQTYYYIVHSTKLLEYASEKCESADVKACIIHHIEDERGHEVWAKGDLRRLGYSLESFPELQEARALYDEIYLGIEKYGPAPIIGYAIALEGLSAAMCPKIAPILSETYGDTCSVLIREHGKIDQDHVKESDDVLSLLTEEELKLVEEFVKSSTDRYLRFMKALEDGARHLSQSSHGNPMSGAPI